MSLQPLPLPVDGDGYPQVRTPRFQARPVVEVEFPSGGADVEVPHSLGRVPIGYLVVGRSGNFVVYNGSVDSTESSLTLASSSAGTAWILIL